jgi:hypothetical protein
VNPFPFKQQRAMVGQDPSTADKEEPPGNKQGEMDDFENMIDDMAYKVWSCGKCLNMGHLTKDCTNEVRCRSCYAYGHVRKNCLAARSNGKVWVPKKIQSNTTPSTMIDKEVHLSGVAGSASSLFNNPVESLQQPREHIKSNPSSVPEQF